MNMNFEKEKNKIEDFGRDLTKMAQNGKIEKIVGRDDEIRRIIRILSRKTKNNPVLIGEPGVGKTAVIEGLATRIVNNQVPENLKNKRIIEISVGALIAGASFQGQFEKRIKMVIDEVEKSKGEIILFIDEFHTLIGAGKNAQSGMDAAQILKPMLARGKSRVIGATTLDEYQKYIESDAAFERRMQKVFIEETNEKETLAILRGIKDNYERFHGVKIQDEALIAATKLSKRYILNHFLPDKAIDLIDEAAASIKSQMHSKPEKLEKIEEEIIYLEMEKISLDNKKQRIRIEEIKNKIEELKKSKVNIENKWNKQKMRVEKIKQLNKNLFAKEKEKDIAISSGNYEKASFIMYRDVEEIKRQIKILEDNDDKILKEDIDENEIYKIVAKQTKIPIEKLMKKDQEKILHLKETLKKTIKGQDEAIERVYRNIIRSKADIHNPSRPLASFLFLGPTGVGKTELAKALAKELFNSSKNLIRIDMSEYTDEISINKIIGSPPGYVGYESGGQLTEKIRNNPHSIVLFDEIEKAHPKVHNLLLQILEEGEITDSKGRLINFKNTIIILTTNIGSMDILANKSHEEAFSKIHRYLKQEIINRIDEIIVFNKLSKESIYEITVNELNKLKLRLNEQKYFINFNKNVINYIAMNSYDPQFGARPIRRYIEQNLEFIIGENIFKNTLLKNNLYNCKMKNDEFVFQDMKNL